jgi:hypothetical protein
MLDIRLLIMNLDIRVLVKCVSIADNVMLTSDGIVN